MTQGILWQAANDDGEASFRHYFKVNPSFGSNCAPSPPQFLVGAIQEKRSFYLCEAADTLGLAQLDIDEIPPRTPHEVLRGGASVCACAARFDGCECKRVLTLALCKWAHGPSRGFRGSKGEGGGECVLMVCV